MNSQKQTMFTSTLLGTCKFVLLSLLVACWFVNLTILGVTAQGSDTANVTSTVNPAEIIENTTLDANVNGTINGTASPNGSIGSIDSCWSQLTLTLFVLCLVLIMNRS